MWRIQVLASGIVAFVAWFVWPSLAGDQLRSDTADLVEVLSPASLLEFLPSPYCYLFCSSHPICCQSVDCEDMPTHWRKLRELTFDV